MIMKDFWRFVSLMVSLLGFLLVAGMLLAKGETLFDAAVRAVLVFAGLWIVLSFLCAILGLTLGTGNREQETGNTEQR